ncbi:DUF2637 domain-containing protein [Plantactinospora sp. BB1]|uniref:DUF2637 domain-containing protein n=1 Tax=Plantactinospora sp. BB1 TaxID=2071627 RepID=UPI000D16CFFA|nr:DUF2637 domain-containing protein [Plantactinospora sp. BB1]AVT37408.1 hypothetical protein C6W10_14070 [Plantactinospora sp. BB1]
MTAPSLTTAPRTVDELLPDARLLVDWLGEVPSRNRLMRDLRIGADKADAIRSRLLAERPADPWTHAVPVGEVSGPDPDPVAAGSAPDPGPGTDTGSVGGAVVESSPERSARPAADVIAAPAAPPEPTPDPGTVRRLIRVRWAVRAVLLLGVAASVAGNVLHAWDNPISQAIAAWPPLALLLTVELISRVPVHRRALAFARMATTAVIAGIAGWVSYWHLVDVARRYGETDASPYLLPLSIDGLIIVASICLVELGGRIADRR